MNTKSPYRKDFPVSWDEMHRNARALAWRLLDQGPWEGIVAITRGGLVPACIMARELEILLIETYCISSYDVKEQSVTKTLKMPDKALKNKGSGWLVIDDLVDTGETFILARETLPEAHFACIYAKPKGLKTTDSYVMEVSQDTWIHFPWDLDTQYVTPMARQGDKGADK